MLAVVFLVFVLGTGAQAEDQGLIEDFIDMAITTYKKMEEEDAVTAISYVVEQLTRKAPDILLDLMTEMVPNFNDVTLDPNDDLKLPLIFNEQENIHDDDGDDEETNENTVQAFTTQNQPLDDDSKQIDKDEISSLETKRNVTKIERDGLKYIEELKSLNVLGLNKINTAKERNNDLYKEAKKREKLYDFYNKKNGTENYEDYSDGVVETEENGSKDDSDDMEEDKVPKLLKKIRLKYTFLKTKSKKPKRRFNQEEALTMIKDLLQHLAPDFKRVLTEKPDDLKAIPTEVYTAAATEAYITVMQQTYKVILKEIKDILDTFEGTTAHEEIKKIYRKTMLPLRSRPVTKVTTENIDITDENTIVHDRDQEIKQTESDKVKTDSVLATRTKKMEITYKITTKTSIHTPLDKVYSEVIEANKKYTTEPSIKKITTFDFDEMLNERPDIRDAFNDKMIENINNVNIDTGVDYVNELKVDQSSSNYVFNAEPVGVNTILSDINENDEINENIEVAEIKHNIRDYVNQEDYDNYLKDQNDNALKFKAIKENVHSVQINNLTIEKYKMIDKTVQNTEAPTNVKHVISENNPKDYVRKEDYDTYIKYQENHALKFKTIATDYKLKTKTTPKSTSTTSLAVRTQSNIESITTKQIQPETSHSITEVTKPEPKVDIPVLLEYIKRLAQDYSADMANKMHYNVGRQDNLRTDVATETTTELLPSTLSLESTIPLDDTSEITAEDHPLTGSIMGKCYVCGMEEAGIPISSQCHDAFDNDYFHTHVFKSSTHKQNAYKKYCRFMDKPHFIYNTSEPRNFWGRWTGGCSVRWVDISTVYTQRTCRNRISAIRGRHFVSKRMSMLEMALQNEDNGCIISPMATLVPLSRGISLFARFHACVCTGSWCNEARGVFTYSAGCAAHTGAGSKGAPSAL